MLCADSKPARVVRALVELMNPRTTPLEDGNRRWVAAIERQNRAALDLMAHAALRNKRAHDDLMRALDEDRGAILAG